MDVLLQRLYQEGYTYREMAKALGMTESAVSVRATRLRQAGLLGRRLQPQPLPDELAERLLALRAQGKTVKAIGETLDMEPQLVEHHLRQLRRAGRLEAGGSRKLDRNYSAVWAAARALAWPMTPRQLAAALYPGDDRGGARARAVLSQWARRGHVVRQADGSYDLTQREGEPADSPHDLPAPT